MREQLSDDELRAAVEDFRAMIAGEPDAGYALTNGDILRLLEELVAARERETEFRARFANGEVTGEPRINAEAAVNALHEAHGEYPFVIEDERIVVQKRTVSPWVQVTEGDDDDQ